MCVSEGAQDLFRLGERSNDQGRRTTAKGLEATGIRCVMPLVDKEGAARVTLAQDGRRNWATFEGRFLRSPVKLLGCKVVTRVAGTCVM